MRDRDRELLEEAYKQIYLREETYLQKLMRLNPGWSIEKAKADFADEYDENDPEDIEDHVDYEENAAEWLDSIASFTPGVKVGDWVKVNVKGGGIKSGVALGRIEKETVLQGHNYGSSGYKGPTTIPAWQIRVFAPDDFNDYLDKVPNTYVLDKVNNKIFSARGHVDYAQHDEIQSNSGVEKYKTFTKQNTFTRYPNQSLEVKELG